MEATLSTKRFTENTATANNHRVDRQAGIVYGVKIIGLESRNGRRYPAGTLKNAAGLYEGAKLFMGHPRREDAGEDRKFQDWCGELRNVKFQGSGLFGDLHLRTKSPFFEEICEAAERFDGQFGLSHEADGEHRHDATLGVDVVESIDRISGVAIVVDPATTKGLFESTYHRRLMEASPAKLQAMIETCRTVLADLESHRDYRTRFAESAERAKAAAAARRDPWK